MCHGTADKLEKNNPQWLIAHVEENIRKTRKKATIQLIEIQTWTEMIRLDMQEAENELRLVQEQIDMAVQEVRASTKKDTAFQRKQMFNKDSRMESHTDSADSGSSADAARLRMIERRNNRTEAK